MFVHGRQPEGRHPHAAPQQGLTHDTDNLGATPTPRHRPHHPHLPRHRRPRRPCRGPPSASSCGRAGCGIGIWWACWRRARHTGRQPTSPTRAARTSPATRRARCCARLPSRCSCPLRPWLRNFWLMKKNAPSISCWWTWGVMIWARVRVRQCAGQGDDGDRTLFACHAHCLKCRRPAGGRQNAFDLLRATFPAGTVSGAPKVRAMEIIEKLERTRRGLYAGIIGYFSYDGNMDSCIAIRTIVMQGDQVHIQSGETCSFPIPRRFPRCVINRWRSSG